MRPVPLSWLNSACSPSTTSGWSAANAREPLSPCSSPLQWPTRIVRFGFGYTAFSIRIASIIMIVPVPLSVAPDAASHESKCAESITYSSGFSAAAISAIVLNTGTSPRKRRLRVDAQHRPLLFSARR